MIIINIINNFINSIDTKLYSRIRLSMGDAECRKYLKEHLTKQLTIHSVVKSNREQLPNIYEGTLNNDRIKIIRTLSDNYNVSIDTIRGLFNDGADFYKQTLTK